jgi:uncharacterized protein YecE (DUF72 family)
MEWHIGCSGFHYKEWKGIFYPDKLPQRKWFEHYSTQFDTLELNVTFYRFPQVSFLENWYAISPDHFSFAVKAPRLITHYKKFKDTERLLEDFYSSISHGLKEKLGPVLFQLPPQLIYSGEVLDAIIESVNPEFDNVVEFRHASWWTTGVQKKLTERGITFCGISYPKLPEQAIINTDLVYYRFHGLAKLYYSAYSNKELERVAAAIHKNKTAKRVFIYFNNTATAAAIENAIYFREFIKSFEASGKRRTAKA